MSEAGCPECWSMQSSVAWEKVRATPIQAKLINEAHFIVSIRACPKCMQDYLQVTTETVDWQDGEDPIHRTVIPLDPQERDRLQSRRPLDIGTIEGVGNGRRSLQYDWPKGQEASTSWSIGVHIGPHD